MDIDFERTLKYKDCLGKYVKVKTVDLQVHEGWLKSIDPLSGNLILLTFDTDNSKVLDTVLIIGDAYSDVEVVKEIDANMKEMIQNLYSSQSYVNTESIKHRKERLLSWIKKNRLPVHENVDDASLVVCESVTIFPPYEPENCSSANGRVLLKIHELLSAMPESDI